jgi:GST-like protein
MGQAGHFRNAAPEKIPYAIERYTNESRRLWGVMDKRLAEAEFLGGDYSIADIATYPWVRIAQREPEQLESLPHLRRWLHVLGNRDAVKRGLAVMADIQQQPLTAEEHSILYGKKQFERR